MLQTFRGLVALFGSGRSRWYGLGALVVLTSAMEALAATLIFALVGLIARGELRLPVLGHLSVRHGDLAPFALAVGVAFLVRAAAAMAHDFVLYRLCYGEGARLEEALLRGYLTLPPREIRRRGHAQLVRNVHDTVMAVVEDCLVPSVLGLGHVLDTIAILGVMMVVTPVPTVVAAVVFAPVLWFISRQVRRPARRLGHEVERDLETSLRTATETLNLAGDIRMAGRGGEFAARFGAVRRHLARAGGTEEVIRGVPRLAAETVLVLFVIGFVVLATARGEADAVLATLGLFAYAALRVLPSLISLVALTHSVAHSGPAVETVLADQPLLHAGARAVAAGVSPSTVRLHDVRVRIPETGRVVFGGATLELRRGDIVAVVGPNGAGKSTLVDVVAGILAPDEGEIFVDGRPLGEIEDAWPGQVAMVPQHVHLLDTDVRTNVTLDLSGEGVDHERLGAVLSAVGLGPVVDRLAGRAVGEDGRMLSGGERQRIAVARALYRQAGVLLMDEGTSALDTSARSALAELVLVNRADRITVVVTHDPQLTNVCNRVVRVEDGTVTEQEPAVTHPG